MHNGKLAMYVLSYMLDGFFLLAVALLVFHAMQNFTFLCVHLGTATVVLCLHDHYNKSRPTITNIEADEAPG